MEKVFIKTMEAITSLRKKNSEFVTTDKSFRQSVVMVCHFVHAKFILFIIRDWNTVLLPFAGVQNTLSFSDEANFHLHVALTKIVLNFGLQKSPRHTIVQVITK